MGLEYFGIDLSDNKVANTESGKLLILGCARCVWDDLDRINHLQYDVMCVNDIGAYVPIFIQHWYSNHADCLDWWVRYRSWRYGDVLSREKPDHFKLHSCFGGKLTYPTDKINKVNRWNIPGHGSSGLNAAYTAIGLGYDEIVLAGLPYDASGHFFDAPDGNRVLNANNRWIKFDSDGFKRLWTNARNNVFDGKVRSLSGMTRDVLGEPG